MSEKAEGQTSSGGLQIVLWSVVVALLALAIGGNSYFSDQVPTLYRAIGVTAIGLVSVFLALQTVKGKAFNQFRKVARVEMRRAVRPRRQVTFVSTSVAMIIVIVIAFTFTFVISLYNMSLYTSVIVISSLIIR